MRITVFTPAYNRGYIIENLYRSLQRQTFRDFEWIVIDDGSTDNTESLFATWLKEYNFFPIKYKKVANGGKHRAINRGVQIAKGELFFIVDSDDSLTDNSLEVIANIEDSIPKSEKSSFAGVCGLKAYSLDRVVGSTFAGSVLDITCLERTNYGISGDKAEVFYTDIMRRFSFPEIDGEKFLTECVVWDKIAYAGYKLRFFNSIVYLCDYLPDGLTHQGDGLFHKNPIGWGLYIYQSILFGKTPQYELRDEILNYYRECKDSLDKKKICDILHISVSLLTFIDIIYKISEKCKLICNRSIYRQILKPERKL